MTIRGFGRGRGKKRDSDPPNTLFSNINPPALTQAELSSNLQHINSIQQPVHNTSSHAYPDISPNGRAVTGNHTRDDSDMSRDLRSSDMSGDHITSHMSRGLRSSDMSGDRGSSDMSRDNCTEVISVESSKIGRIIGSRGATINNIQDESGARVDIDKDNDGHEKDVTLSGSAEAVAKARDMISDILGDNNNNNSRQSAPRVSSNTSDSVEVFRVAENSVGRIIGKSGCTINQIRDDTGVNIDISKDSVGYDKEVTLTGSASAIAKAKDMISDLVAIIGNDEPVNKGYIDYDTPIDWGQVAANELKYRQERWGVLAPVEKDFYREDPQVSRLSESDVAQIRAENMAIEVSHYIKEDDKDKPEVYVTIPKPILTFEHAFQNYPDILAEIYKQGFKDPSPIQKQMWPVLLSGHDCIGVAQTGTGKTLAFLLPAFIHIEAQAVPREKRVGPTVFCLAPTRELALQIKWEVRFAI